MKDRKEILDFLETTQELDPFTHGEMRDEWHYGDMIEALNLLAEEYEKLREKYERPDNDSSSDYHMMALLSNNLHGIRQMRNILENIGDTEFLEEIKRCFVGIILDYYRFLREFIKKKEGVKA